MHTAMQPEAEPEPLVPPPLPAAMTRPPAPGPAPTSPPRRVPPGGVAALAHGARRVLSQPRLVLFMWGLSMVTAMIASSPAMVALSTLLGRRPAAARLARGEADYLFGELAGDHPASVAVIVASALAAAGAYFLLQLALSGGVLSALRQPGHPQRVGPHIHQIIARGLSTAAAMVRLELVFLLLVRVPLVLLCGAALAFAGRAKFTENHSLTEIIWQLAPLAGLTLWLWCCGTVVLQVARLRRLTQTAGAGSSLRAVGEALARTLGRAAGLRVTLTLALTAALGMTALVVAGRVLAARLDYALLVGSALLVRQGFALLRTILTLSVMAGAVDYGDATD